jgi:hypothetical protein
MMPPYSCYLMKMRETMLQGTTPDLGAPRTSEQITCQNVRYITARPEIPMARLKFNDLRLAAQLASSTEGLDLLRSLHQRGPKSDLPSTCSVRFIRLR